MWGPSSSMSVTSMVSGRTSLRAVFVWSSSESKLILNAEAVGERRGSAEAGGARRGERGYGSWGGSGVLGALRRLLISSSEDSRYSFGVIVWAMYPSPLAGSRVLAAGGPPRGAAAAPA